MLERVSAIARVKGTDCDVNSPYLRKNSGEDQYKEGSPFQRMLQKQIEKDEAPAPIAEAYVLDCNKVTQSLFYQNGVDLRFFQGTV